MLVKIIAAKPRNKEWDTLYRDGTRSTIEKIEIASLDSPVEIMEPAEIVTANSEYIIVKHHLPRPRSLGIIDRELVSLLGLVKHPTNEPVDWLMKTIRSVFVSKQEEDFYWKYRTVELVSAGEDASPYIVISDNGD